MDGDPFTKEEKKSWDEEYIWKDDGLLMQSGNSEMNVIL